MKRITLLFISMLLVAAVSTLSAQQSDSEPVIFNADLQQVFDLVVVNGGVQTITFDDAGDYNVGVNQAEGIAPGFTQVTMEATGNWFLEISAPDFTGAGTIPIENLGVWVEATGTHQFGVEVTSSHQTAATAMGIQIGVQTLIDLNGAAFNGGDASDNAFTLHWLMGTMQGSMEPTSMFDQMALGLFGPGAYSTTATLTMWEIP